MAGPVARPAAWTLAVCLAAVVAGCGGPSAASGPFYPVKGKVTLSDGKPLAGVSVVFLGPVVARAATESDGSFTVKSGDKDGLPEGDYSVRLEVLDTKGSVKKAVLPFPGKYLDEDSSDLKAKVTAAGPNDLDFKLTKNDAATGRPGGQGRGAAKDND
jgi:Carboxypeptidase regulatory-like domain